MENGENFLPLGECPSIGAFQAKTHLAKLLDRVAAGEVIIITRNGIPVARLEPVIKVQSQEANKIFDQFCDFQRCHKVDSSMTAKDLISEGRRI